VNPQITFRVRQYAFFINRGHLESWQDFVACGNTGDRCAVSIHISHEGGAIRMRRVSDPNRWRLGSNGPHKSPGHGGTTWAAWLHEHGRIHRPTVSRHQRRISYSAVDVLRAGRSDPRVDRHALQVLTLAVSSEQFQQFAQLLPLNHEGTKVFTR
jgi:hypothetical protein